ncbi:TLC domain-containing protein [Paramyrothecium foliicola]|nr:TLC domain-containing protein [Paramyrothecium foliicola]
MKDPFFIPPLPWLSELVQPFADYFGFASLPLHVHEILAAALFYSVIFYPISPILSKLLAPQHYTALPRKSRLNWDAHVVSMVQSTLINGLALWVMWQDEERKHMNWEERIWGYTGAAGLIQSLAAGYFVWDLVVTSLHLDVFGLGTLAHAISALLVYSLGFRPFINYYGCIFILYELSTPFLNVHWFMDKMKMTGSRAQLYNGLMLLFTFFSCRLVYGTYQSVRVFGDIFSAINVYPSAEELASPVMTFATDSSTVPLWLGVVYLASNLTLNSLNFYWFFKMIQAVRKRFVAPKAAEKEPLVSSNASGLSTVPVARRRKA